MYIYIYIGLDWIGLERPSAKRQTPDLRRHPSHLPRTRCNVFRLEIKQAPAPAQRAGKEKLWRRPRPRRIHNRVLNPGSWQPPQKSAKPEGTTQPRPQAKPKQNTLDQIGGAVAHALPDLGPRSRAGNRPYTHRLQTVRRRVGNRPYTLHIER